MVSNATSPNRSTLLLVALLAFCLVAANVWTFSKMLASQNALSEARDEMRNNQRLVAEIKKLKDRPRIASLEEESVTGMQERVNDAMLETGIASDRKLSVNSLPIDTKGTNYKERRTEVPLQELTLPQIIQFCERLEDPQIGLTVRDLELKASNPSASSPSDLWDVTVTLSQLIYAGQDASRGVSDRTGK